MAIRHYILDYLKLNKDPTSIVTFKDLYDEFPLFKKSSIRSSVYSMAKKGTIERLDAGVYLYEQVRYGKYRHAKRIYDTHKPPNLVRHPYDIDLELTCEGFAPLWVDIQDVEDLVNPKLLERSL